MRPEPVWEPWDPMEGDRVIIKVSPECICRKCGGDPHSEDCRKGGMEAVVEWVWPKSWKGGWSKCCGNRMRGHRFYVTSADGEGGCVAASEIELVKGAE